jgi:hypothetical protein
VCDNDGEEDLLLPIEILPDFGASPNHYFNYDFVMENQDKLAPYRNIM